MLGQHRIKSWSSTQTSISLSSGEAEFYGVVKAAGVGLGYRSLLQDLGVHLPLRVWTDSTATIGICGRRGLGKLRHIATQHLWIQHRVRDGTFELRKVLGSENPADVFTTHLSSAQHVECVLKLFGCEYLDGRAESAPQLRQTAGTRAEESLLAGDLLATTTVTTEYQGMVVRDGVQYPGILHDGILVPDARPTGLRCLPHEHSASEIANLFPRAVASEEEEEWEHDDSELEMKGVMIGNKGSRDSVERDTTCK